MGVMGGNCCGLARYQTVMAIGGWWAALMDCTALHCTALHCTTPSINNWPPSGISLIVADAALFMVNIGNVWTQ
jgi:hypothetical protein